MKVPHKHRDLIIAWANGEKIQYYNHDCKWVDVEFVFPVWYEEEYRIKPEISLEEKLYNAIMIQFDVDRFNLVMKTLLNDDRYHNFIDDDVKQVIKIICEMCLSTTSIEYTLNGVDFLLEKVGDNQFYFCVKQFKNFDGFGFYFNI